MARRMGRERRERDRAAGHAPHGEVKRVEQAVKQLYDGLYIVNFHSYQEDGSRIYKAYLHSPTGPVVWAVIHRKSPDVTVGSAAHADVVRLPSGRQSRVHR